MTSDKSKKILSFRSFLNYLLSFLLAVIFLYIAFHDVDFDEVLEIASNANLFWMIIFISLFYLGHLLRAYRWKFILLSVKPDTKFSHLFGSLMIGYGVNCITPKLGEVTRAVLFGRWEGLSRSSMFGTVILERIIDIIALAVSVLIAIIISTENIRESFPWLLTTLYVSAVLIFIFILFLYFILRYEEKFSKWIIKILNRFSHSIADKVAYIFSMLTQGFFSLKGRKNLLHNFFAFSIDNYSLCSYFLCRIADVKYATYSTGYIHNGLGSDEYQFNRSNNPNSGQHRIIPHIGKINFSSSLWI